MPAWGKEPYGSMPWDRSLAEVDTREDDFEEKEVEMDGIEDLDERCGPAETTDALLWLDCGELARVASCILETASLTPHAFGASELKEIAEVMDKLIEVVGLVALARKATS